MEHEKIFDEIYKKNLWKVGSGTGSTLENTKQYRWFLQNFLATNRIKSVLDLGCGDWQFSKNIDWSGIKYLGVDVSAVVLENTSRFSDHNIEFEHLNAVTDELPSADLLIVKDVIQHWSNSEIMKFFSKLKSFRMALITNGFHPAGMKNLNANITPGNWRPVDLKKLPFNLPGNYVYWFNGGEPKMVFLWVNPLNAGL